MPASSRRYPYVGFTMDRELGKDVLTVSGLSKTVDGVKVLDNVSFTVGREDKIAFVANNEFAVPTLFKILMEELEPDEGTFKWGVSTSRSYFPQDNSAYFGDTEDSIIKWLEQYSKDTTETYLRGFLGKMLFSGEDVYKPVQVLSGGEKVRCMLAHDDVRQQRAAARPADEPPGPRIDHGGEQRPSSSSRASCCFPHTTTSSPRPSRTASSRFCPRAARSTA